MRVPLATIGEDVVRDRSQSHSANHDPSVHHIIVASQDTSTVLDDENDLHVAFESAMVLP